MSTRKLRTVENLIMLTFPLVLFAGCAGSDIKPVENKIPTTYQSQSSEKELATPVKEVEVPQVSLIEPEIEPEPSTENQAGVDTKLDEVALTQGSDDSEPVTVPQNNILFFDTDIHALSQDQRHELKQHAEYLIGNSAAVLTINGHADVRGTQEYNQVLSEKRAEETYKLLIEYGVSEAQLLTKGFGESAPMNDESNWKENRRVELQYTDPMMMSSM